MLVLTVLTPRDVARNGRTRQVTTPMERLFPTNLPESKARGSTRSVGSGEPASPVYI